MEDRNTSSTTSVAPWCFCIKIKWGFWLEDLKRRGWAEGIWEGKEKQHHEKKETEKAEESSQFLFNVYKINFKANFSEGKLSNLIPNKTCNIYSISNKSIKILVNNQRFPET